MSNYNCLQGMRCPQCKSDEAFRMEGRAVFLVTDEGTEEHGDIGWVDDGFAECVACKFAGKVHDFYIENQGR